MLQHGAGADEAQLLALQAVAGHEAVNGRGQHVLVRGVGVLLVGAGERNAVATEDGDLARRSVSHVLNHSMLSVGLSVVMRFSVRTASEYELWQKPYPKRYGVRDHTVGLYMRTYIVSVAL